MADLGPNDVMSLAGLSITQKADIVRATLVSDGGFLTQAEAEEFIEQPYKKAKVLNEVNRMMQPRIDFQIPYMRFPDGVDEFVLQPVDGRDHEALSVAERSKPDIGSTTLHAKQFSAQVNIPNDLFLTSVEKEGLINKVRELLFGKVQADMEKIALRGDTTSAIIQLAVADGWLKLATAHTVPAASARLSTNLCESAIKAMPQEYTDEGDMAFMATRNCRLDLIKELRTRGTQLGDVATTSPDMVKDVLGFPMFEYALWPPTFGLVAQETTVLFAPRKNMIFSIYQDVQLEIEKTAVTRNVAMVMTVYFAVDYEIRDASVAINAVNNA